MLSDFKGADEDFSRRRPEPQGPQGLGNRCLLAVVEQAGRACPTACAPRSKHFRAYNNIGYALFELDKVPEAQSA